MNQMYQATNLIAVPEPSTLLLLLIIAIVVVVSIASRRTRSWGIALLCLGGLAIVVGFLGIFAYRMTRVGGLYPSVTVIENRTTTPSFPHNGQTVIRGAIEARTAHESSTKHLTQSDKPTTSPTVKMFEAMGRALSKAAVGERKTPVVAAKPVVKPTTTATDDPGKPTPESITPKAAPRPPPTKLLPAWVNQPPRIVGDGAYQMSIVVGPWPTRQDCDAHLPEELQKVLDQYAKKCLGGPPRTRIVLPTEYLRQHLVVAECEEDIESESVGRMKQLHVLLRFDSDIKERVLAEHHRTVAERRLWAVGLGVAAVLWPLAAIYAYLKIDLATGGAYRGRLRFAALLAILAPMAAALAVVA
jgi:hypothetical protein